MAHNATEPTMPDFAPLRMVEVELGGELPRLPGGRGELGIDYRAAQCLVRLHGRPLGFAQADLPPGGIEPEALAELIWDQLGAEIQRHLEEDGLEAPGRLSARGLPPDGTPLCRRKDEEFLEQAPFVSVVVPTRNRPSSAVQTVTGIAECDYPGDRCEVIVIDNASGEDARVEPAAIEAAGALSSRVVAEPAPGGSNARNRGLREARGDVVVFADDDIEPDRDWLARMVEPFADPRVGGVAGLTAPGKLETPSQLWFEGFGGFMRGLERRVYDLDEPPPDRPLFPFTVGDLGSGQNMAFRRETLLELGGFDPALGTATLTLAGEDLEAMLRVLVAGHRVVYEPAAIVRHEHQREYEQFQRRVWGYGVGVTACLTCAVRANPRLLPLLLRKLPRGLVYALSPRSAKNEGKQHSYPPELTRLELRGMAYGPIAYARSRRRLARERRAERPTAPASDRRPLRILIVTDSHPPLIGGANRSVELLSRHLAARGHSVEVATAWQPGLPAHEDFGAVRVHRIRDLSSRMRWVSEDPYKHNPPPFPDPEAVRELRRLIRDFQPDLVHAYGWLAHSSAAALGRAQIPLLLSARDYGNVCAVRTLIRNGTLCDGPAAAKCVACASRFYGPAKGPVAALSVLGAGPLLRRRTTAIHSVSRFVAEKMDHLLRVEKALEVVIPNFQEAASEEAVDEAIMARLPDEPFILYVGAFRRIKGIEDLAAAYGRLDGAPPLVVVGTRAPDTPSEFPPAGAISIEDVPHATVMAIWERALFGVLPTRAPEALGNVVLEAMSKGRAMIGTRPGGQEDLIEDGVTGLLVPAGDIDALADAMQRLIADPDRCARLGGAAKEQSRDFTAETVMPQFERLYYETVAHFEGSRT